MTFQALIDEATLDLHSLGYQLIHLIPSEGTLLTRAGLKPPRRAPPIP